jgi:hypothetical protein
MRSSILSDIAVVACSPVPNAALAGMISRRAELFMVAAISAAATTTSRLPMRSGFAGSAEK